MSKGVQIAIGVTAIVLLLSWYGSTQLSNDLSFQYFQNLEEFHANGPGMVGRSVRVHGYVAAESIERDLEGKRVRFSVQNDPTHSGIATGRTLDVLYLGLETPDLFKDGAEVVVEGTLQYHETETVFLADNLMAKCPSKFEAQAEGGAPVAQGGVNL